MIAHDVSQGTDAWLALRAGIPTASELNRIITPAALKPSTDKAELGAYIASKVAEKWLGRPLQSFGGGVLEQGDILEDEAIPAVAAELRINLDRPGFITTDAGDFGSSPDAMERGTIGHVTGYEIKCPQPPNHVQWLTAPRDERRGRCPRAHWLQCQGGMYATGASLWRFVSYCRGFPMLVVDVPIDEEVQAVIATAVCGANGAIGAAYDRLCELNGGPPKRRTPRPVPQRDPDPFGGPDHPIDLYAGFPMENP